MKRKVESKPHVRDLHKEAYLRHKGTICPYCRGEMLRCPNDWEVISTPETYEQVVKCQNCFKQWTDIYTLTDVKFED